LPSFGFFCATVVSLVVIAFVIDYANRPFSKGIRVAIRSPYQGPSLKPIVVRIEDLGPNFPHRLHVSSKLVSRDEFENALKDELKRRPDWVVYVEADPNLPWMAVVDVSGPPISNTQ
jgi:biopolymer transport protein ExbD